MRVTQLEIGRNLLADLERLNKNFIDVNRQLQNGKKLNKLSDSPLGSADLVDITEQSQKLDTYRKNLIAGKYQLQSAEAVLNKANNAFVAIHTLGMEAANETYTPSSREAMLLEIENLREELMAIGNTKVNGLYIFAGTAVDTTPFVLNGDKVEYRGNEYVNTIPVADGVEVTAGVYGSQVLGDVFSEVDKLIEALRNSISGAGSSEDIGNSLDGFGAALEKLGQARGQVGVNLSTVERMSAMLDTRNVVLREQRSNIEDANILDASVKISELQTAISAAMTSGGVVLQQNTLFDIIG